ncbi:MAG: GntR family transcriptional regulator [Anaerolineae bacterium]|nr:GntR family transcriptional regulator [Anaerolineae bacterium]
MNVQPHSSEPFYIQIKNYLQMQIQTGAYPVGARLPSERELAEQFNVSRMTARQALLLLAREGLTYTRVGKGTYVSPPKFDQDLDALRSFTEEMRQRGVEPSSRVLEATLRPADDEVAARLQIAPGAEVVVLSRVRLADGKPLAIETTHLDHQMCPGILDGHDFSRESLYGVLRREYGWVLVWADQIIEARLPQPHERRLLNIDRQTPVLGIRRTTYSRHDRPVEFVYSVYRGDQYQLRAILRHPDTTAISGVVQAPAGDSGTG